MPQDCEKRLLGVSDGVRASGDAVSLVLKLKHTD
jgi:hypothetical protein